ncbi:hypothetical protein PIB30_044326 [Stylosanthes scabra]|uniref:Uncharacterized protein n=1 Tax=Stylosanthes scabra TaxID=79078 RepID=A0ABU6ZEJ7_9FABA|nr:hypothetical protein [Stylosanthes scabra]
MHQLPPPSSSVHVSPSPSFSSYSSETLADIAARVINELHQNDAASSVVLEEDHDSLFQPWEEKNENQNQNDNNHDQNDDDEDEEEFEFTFSRHQNASPISADDIFYNGQIKPMYMYPLFGAPLPNDNNNDAVSSVPVPNNNNNYDDDSSTTVRRRLPLRMLMFEDSCSSENDSVVDDDNSLEAVPEGTYCVWNPNNSKVASMDRNNKKSNSTGTSSSSKRWKIRELLLRSHSDGKGNKNRSSNGNGNGDGGDNKKREFVFGVTSKRTIKVAAAKAGSGDGYGGASVERDGKSGRKSVFPYKQELIGIFANVNGVGRNLHPF